MFRISCVQPNFCVYKNFSCVQVQVFEHSQQFPVFNGLSCVHVQTSESRVQTEKTYVLIPAGPPKTEMQTSPRFTNPKTNTENTTFGI